MPDTRLHPENNGNRIHHKPKGMIYLVDKGSLRHIPGPATMERLFRDWSFIEVPEIDTWVVDPHHIHEEARLEQAENSGMVFLIDYYEGPNGLGWYKRHVGSPAAMDKYNFRWPGQKTADVVLGEITTDNESIV